MRITKDIIDQISYGLVEPIKKKLEIDLLAIENLIKYTYLQQIPSDLVDIWLKYPKLIKITNSYRLSSKTYTNMKLTVPIYGIEEYEYSIETYLNGVIDYVLAKDSKAFYKIKEDINRYCKKELEVKTLSDTIKFKLKEFRTTNQLKKSFPEAYDILIKLPNYIDDSNKIITIKDLVIKSKK